MWCAGRRYPNLDSDKTTGRFDGYVVVVAGGASGIGRAAVERFANDGATVYILDIRIDESDLEEIKLKHNGKVTFLRQDITDSEGCKKTASHIAARHNGSIHTLVNTAAFFGSKGLTAVKDDWMKTFEVNVCGYGNTVQACVPFMHPGQNCSIVNLSSISAHRAQPDRWTYSASKGAISSMSRCMALDLRDKEIRVNALSPSWIWTPEVAKAGNYDRDSAEKTWTGFHIRDTIPDVEEVAAVIAFLASKDAGAINGADIPACAGYLAIGPERRGENSKFAGTEYSA